MYINYYLYFILFSILEFVGWRNYKNFYFVLDFFGDSGLNLNVLVVRMYFLCIILLDFLFFLRLGNIILKNNRILC